MIRWMDKTIQLNLKASEFSILANYHLLFFAQVGGYIALSKPC